MTKINLDELRADREAGTDGPWAWNEEYGYYTLSPGIFISDSPDGTPWGDNIDKANARRIARLPDLEAAYIEAVETLRVIAAEAYVAVDEGYPWTWRNVAVERIDIARAFLERNK